jgi:hypothetical protein
MLGSIAAATAHHLCNAILEIPDSQIRGACLREAFAAMVLTPDAANDVAAYNARHHELANAAQGLDLSSPGMPDVEAATDAAIVREPPSHPAASPRQDCMCCVAGTVHPCLGTGRSRRPGGGVFLT